MASACIVIYVKLPTGKAIELQHLPSETVRQITQKIADSEKVRENRVRLKYQGKIIDKSKTIQYLGICSETILKADIVFPQDVAVTIRFLGAEHHVTFQTVDTLADLHQQITALTGLSEAEQLIKSGNATLNRRDLILTDLGVTGGSVLSVTKKPTQTPGANTENANENNEVNEDLKEELLSTFDSRGRPVDVVFCFDTTGSMYSVLTNVRQKLNEICSRLISDIPCIRIGIIANGDYCDSEVYVVRYVDLTTDVRALCDFANNVPPTGGGGNGGEAYEWALRRAQQLDWGEDSAKALVMIGDEPPHHKHYTDQKLFWKDELDVLVGMGVKVYGVQAMYESRSTPFYQELALRSSGFYLKLKDFRLITDMFLAVCYREADDGQFETFAEEVKKEGRMTEDTKLFLDELNKQSQADPVAEKEEREKRYVDEGWWDPYLVEHELPKYFYNQETDHWVTTPSTNRPSSATNSRVQVLPIISVQPSYMPIDPKRKSRLRKILGFFKKE
ncbi:uncharacterized protein LOC127849297 [Dreissena polymorpha]|uniref:Ubiquitin-like domain-containing protein n=1 Tax=Dreissena polymorpha TaxID=45954 RepID=A0A9D4IBL4_DREPO|nr:uncharacterized protein LOC127849297 [Dreissena polymorpha]KAH3755364.1 hypothetical protein DPMN_190057 [Dreissena polymorpha]